VPHHNKKADKLQTPAAGDDQAPPDTVPADIVQRGTQDPQSVRAKTTGHGKKTADKWNQ
jgi:hypothetical protein